MRKERKLEKGGTRDERVRALRSALREYDFGFVKHREKLAYRVIDERIREHQKQQGIWEISLEGAEEWFLSSALDARDARTPKRKLTSQEAEALLEEAYKAARSAGNAEAERLKAVPHPSWHNPWGTASVTIHPARGAIITALKKRGAGSDAYRGGYRVGFGPVGMMMEAKAAAEAFAKTLSQAGVKAYAQSQLD